MIGATLRWIQEGKRRCQFSFSNNTINWCFMFIFPEIACFYHNIVVFSMILFSWFRKWHCWVVIIGQVVGEPSEKSTVSLLPSGFQLFIAPLSPMSFFCYSQLLLSSQAMLSSNWAVLSVGTLVENLIVALACKLQSVYCQFLPSVFNMWFFDFMCSPIY